MVIPIDGTIPDPRDLSDESRREGWVRALEYMDLESGTPISEVKIDKVFIGSCTNGRIEDLRAAAQVARGHRVASNVSLAMVVPGSGLVKRQAESEGLDAVFTRAGFEWREPGCSMCLAMNADRLEPGERCASTSNRNFEGRQGQGGRTHLVSPAMAAAAAVAGHFVDPVELEINDLMEAFKNRKRRCLCPSIASNVDTDAIIPKQYLKSVARSGFGANLFDEWRYLDHGEPGQEHSNRPINPNFVLE